MSKVGVYNRVFGDASSLHCSHPFTGHWRLLLPHRLLERGEVGIANRRVFIFEDADVVFFGNDQLGNRDRWCEDGSEAHKRIGHPGREVAS